MTVTIAQKHRFVMQPAPHPARARAHAALDAIPDGWEVIMQPPTRNADQNAKFHAICGDIAKSAFPWAGKPRRPVQWKGLLVSGHAIASGEGAEMVPGIEHEYVNLRESTALMSVKRSASLITYSIAFCDLNGITLRDERRRPTAADLADPETGEITNMEEQTA